MFIPEYSLTPKMLKHIANIEYSKAVIENTTLLPSWENKLKKEAKVKTIFHFAHEMGSNLDLQQTKAIVDEIDKPKDKVIKIIDALKLVEDLSEEKVFDEECIKNIGRALSDKSGFRETSGGNKPTSEEILALIVQFIDWLESLDAKETHPLIVAGITKLYLLSIEPFLKYNEVISDLITYLILNNLGYSFKNYLCLEEYFAKSQKQYTQITQNVSYKNPEFTEWLEYFTEGLNMEISNIKEKIKLLARDTKIAKASGRARLTLRQEKIVEYLQDYGILQNKDFPRIFPDVSEDSVLRDLKVLIEKNIIMKSGSTKSSFYELA
jgi:Fic family protein